MRILHVIPSLSPSTGGPAHAITGMCKALQAEGADVTIATTTAFLRDSVVTRRIADHRGIPTIYFACQVPPHLSVSLGLARWLSKNIRSFDVVHIHSAFNYPSAMACRIAAKQRVPYIVRPLGVLSPYSLGRHSWRKRLYLKIERRNLNGASALHFTAQSEADEAAQLHLKPPNLVLPLGVETPEPVSSAEVQRFRDHHKLGSDFTLLYLGRLDPKKGLESLFEALASVKAEVPAWRLLIAGSGDAAYTAALKAMPSRMGIADRVLFLGEVKGKEKSVAFRAADVFVLPSLHENFAVAAAEALSSGLPVIVSKAVGISPYVAERHCGVVTDGTSTSLGAAIVKLSHDAALRREMSENGRRLAAEVFNWRSIARELMRVYFEFAANNVAHTPAACAD